MCTLAETAQIEREDEFVRDRVTTEAPKLAKRLLSNDTFIHRVYESYDAQFFAAIKQATVEGDYIACGKQLDELIRREAKERAEEIMREECEHYLRCIDGIRHWTEDAPEPPEAEFIKLEHVL